MDYRKYEAEKRKLQNLEPKQYEIGILNINQSQNIAKKKQNSVNKTASSKMQQNVYKSNKVSFKDSLLKIGVN